MKFPHAITPDGRFILYLMRGEKTRLDIWALSMAGAQAAPTVMVNWTSARKK